MPIHQMHQDLSNTAMMSTPFGMTYLSIKSWVSLARLAKIILMVWISLHCQPHRFHSLPTLTEYYSRRQALLRLQYLHWSHFPNSLGYLLIKNFLWRPLSALVKILTTSKSLIFFMKLSVTVRYWPTLSLPNSPIPMASLGYNQTRRHGYFWHACIGLRWNLDWLIPQKDCASMVAAS